MIFIISGTPGSGKSSVAAALMQRFPRGLHIPIDDLREWVVSGIAHPVPRWTEETSRQFRLAREAAAQVAGLYAAAGFAVAIDDVIAPAEVQSLFVEPLAGHTIHTVLLRPSLDVTLARNVGRTNKQFDTQILTEVIEHLYHSINERSYSTAGWIIIDNSTLSLDETVERILILAEKRGVGGAAPPDKPTRTIVKLSEPS